MGTRVYVGRLPYRATERDVQRFFQGYGHVREIFLKNGYGFVEFDDYRDADDACYELNGRELMGERLIVELARGTPHGRDRYGWRPPPQSSSRYSRKRSRSRSRSPPPRRSRSRSNDRRRSRVSKSGSKSPSRSRSAEPRGKRANSRDYYKESSPARNGSPQRSRSRSVSAHASPSYSRSRSRSPDVGKNKDDMDNGNAE